MCSFMDEIYLYEGRTDNSYTIGIVWEPRNEKGMKDGDDVTLGSVSIQPDGVVRGLSTRETFPKYKLVSHQRGQNTEEVRDRYFRIDQAAKREVHQKALDLVAQVIRDGEVLKDFTSFEGRETA